MDGSVLKMPPPCYRYYAGLGLSERAPPASALPMPKFFRRTITPANTTTVVCAVNETAESTTSPAESVTSREISEGIVGTFEESSQLSMQTPTTEPSSSIDAGGAKSISSDSEHESALAKMPGTYPSLGSPRETSPRPNETESYKWEDLGVYDREVNLQGVPKTPHLEIPISKLKTSREWIQRELQDVRLRIHDWVARLHT